MPRLLRRFPAYQRHSSGQACVRLNGRVHYLGRYDSQASRIAYDRLIAEWLARGRQPLVAEDDGLTVAELVARFWEHAKGYYRKNGEPTTELACYRDALVPLLNLYGDHPVAEFDGSCLEAVREQMIRGGWTASQADAPKRRGWSRGTVNKQVRRVVRAFRWGVPKRLVPPEVLTSLDAVEGLREGRCQAPDRPPVAPVADADVELTLPHLHETLQRLVMFQRFTGCRPGEACNLRPCDIDRSGPVWLYKPASHKTQHHGRQRVIAIGARAQGVLLPLLEHRKPTEYLFRPSDVKPGTGDKYETNAYQKAVRRAAKRAGVPEWSPNQLRHAAATAVRAKFGLEAAQHVLGHARADVTQVYAERDMSKAIQVAAEIG